MKRTTKKLSLSAETVRNLEGPGLENVAGGATSIDYPCHTSNGPLRCFCPRLLAD